MNTVVRIHPDVATPADNPIYGAAEAAFRTGHDEMIVLRMSELTVMNRRAIAEQLSASIAHEINQPIAAIASSGSAALRWLSLETPDLDEVRASLKRIVADSHRAAKVIDAVRAMYSRDTRSRAIVDLNALFAEVLDLMRTEVAKHGVTVQTVETGMRPRVFVNRVQLQQVVINLIRNAIDAMSTVTDRPRILRIRIWRNDGEVRGYRRGAQSRRRGQAVRAVFYDQAARHGHGPFDLPKHHRSARWMAPGCARLAPRHRVRVHRPGRVAQLKKPASEQILAAQQEKAPR